MSRDTPNRGLMVSSSRRKTLIATQLGTQDKSGTLSIPVRSHEEGKTAVEHIRKFLGKYLAEASEIERDSGISGDSLKSRLSQEAAIRQSLILGRF